MKEVTAEVYLKPWLMNIFLIFFIVFFLLKIFDSRKTCEFLISKGADVSAKCMNNVTPLHLAVMVGSLETVVVLMNPFLASTLEEKDSDGNTPLHLACRYNRLDVLQFLLDRGADVTVRNERSMTCVDLAIEWEAEDVAKTLVKHQRYVLRELCSRHLSYPTPGGKGVFRISSDGDDGRGRKSKPKKIRMASNKTPKYPWNKN